MKVCSICKTEKPLSEFYARSDYPEKRHSHCKLCAKTHHGPKYRANHKTDIKAWHAQHYIEKQDEIKARNSAWQKANLESSRARVARHRAKDVEKARRKTRESARRWYAKHKPKSVANGKRYVLLKQKRMPSWANQQYIADMYMLAALVSEATGIKYHVDHIVPLRGKKVCGLHVEHNLQVIPASENLQKGERFSI